MDDAITDLQTRLTYQDETLQQLTKTVLKQEKELESLTAEVGRLKALLYELSSSSAVGSHKDEAPPHY